MNRTLPVVLLLVMTAFSGAFAQDSLNIAEPKSKKTPMEREDVLVLDFTYETFFNRPEDVNYRFYNNGFGLQLMYDNPIGTSRMSAAIGLGFSTQSYYSNAQVRRVQSNVDPFYSDWVNVDSIDYRNNKISTSYFEIPVELRWRSNPKPSGYSWKVTVGLKAGYLFDTHDKIVHSNGDKYKTYIFPDMNRLRGVGLIRVGYGKVMLVSSYSFTPWFNVDNGPEMNQFSIGLSIQPF